MNSEAVIRDCLEVVVEGPDTSVLRLGLLVPLSGPLGIIGLDLTVVAAPESRPAFG